MVEQLIGYTNGKQYDGGNGSEILAAIPPQQVIDYRIELRSEAGGTAVFASDDGAGPVEHSLTAGDWLIWTSSTPQRYTDAQINDTFVKRSQLP